MIEKDHSKSTQKTCICIICDLKVYFHNFFNLAINFCVHLTSFLEEKPLINSTFNLHAEFYIYGKVRIDLPKTLFRGCSEKLLKFQWLNICVRKFQMRKGVLSQMYSFAFFWKFLEQRYSTTWNDSLILKTCRSKETYISLAEVISFLLSEFFSVLKSIVMQLFLFLLVLLRYRNEQQFLL